MFLISLLISATSCQKTPEEPRLAFGKSESRWVKKILSRMTLEEKIGQLMTISYSGRFFNRDSEEMARLEHLIVNRKVGGMILYGESVYETAILTNTCQTWAEIPLLIASDLERGLGNQIQGTTQFPPLMALGALGREDYVYRIGEITAREARAIGIHLTYAPVVDVNINPDNPIIDVRSFGESPEDVSRLAALFIKGCQDHGLLATAKHFPGHGDTDKDSHLELPTVNGDLERLERVELYPFRKAIEAGVSVIMTAHLYLPALDPTPDLPATLSHRIITDLLRKELGFKGLIVTDAMTMDGVTKLYSPEVAAVMAIKAGVDMILSTPAIEEVIDALIQSVRAGEISEQRIDDSVRRILEAKARLGLHKKKLVKIEALDQILGSRNHLQLAQQCYEEAITLVKNDNQVLPLSDPDSTIAVFSLSSDPGGYYAGQALIGELEERFPGLVSFCAEATTGEEYLEEGKQLAEGANVLIFALFSARRARKGSVDLNLSHVQMIKEASDGDTPVVAISFGSPYFLRRFPDIDAYMCVYRYTREAQITAAKALMGEIDIKGRLPVSIPEFFPMGYGLVLPKSVDKPNSQTE